MNNISVKVDNVSKCFSLQQRGYRSLREDIINILKRRRYGKDFYAINNVSFELKKGEILGIIGPNGAGKSTMLKLLAKVMFPSSGQIYTNGRIGALIELAAGFHHELTGTENIYYYGAILGMKKKEISDKFDAIVEFSELKDFLDTPIKKYSSGMKARLGFAVSVHLSPDILLVDEVLSVGDFAFQEKCIAKMEEYKNSNVSIIFVSHNMDSIRKLCKRTILLEKGYLTFDGNTPEAITRYFTAVSKSKKTLINEKEGEKKEIVKITDTQLLNSEGRLNSYFNSEDTAIFRYKAAFLNNAKVFFNFVVSRNDRLYVYDTSQYLLKKEYVEGNNGDVFLVEFIFKVNLLKGSYQIGTHITDFDNNIYLDYIDHAVSFLVAENISYSGVANLKADVKVAKMD